MNTWKDCLYYLGGFIILLSVLLIWELVLLTGIIPSTALPPVDSVLRFLYLQIIDGSVLVASSATLTRLFEGYAIACVAGVMIGIGMGLSINVEKTSDVLLQLLRPMPSIVLIPLAILYLGFRDVIVIPLVVYASIWPIIINTLDGVKSIDPLKLDVGRMCGISGLKKIRKIILPASAPFIFSGFRVSLAIAITVAITSEIVAGTSSTGLGILIFYDLNSGNLQPMYAVIIVAATVAYMLNRLLLVVERVAIPWHYKSKVRIEL